MIDRRVLHFLVWSIVIAIVTVWSYSLRSVNDMATERDELSSSKYLSINVAHIGNSIQYYNDLPRLLEQMLSARYESVFQDSCLRGGATLASLFEKGNGMANKFSSRPDVSRKEDGTFDIGSPTVEKLLTSSLHTWDVVIMNDHTQSPARPEKKQESMNSLQSEYIPLLMSQIRNTAVSKENDGESRKETIPTKLQLHTITVIFIQTAAYRNPVKDSEDLGTFDQFTESLQRGYEDYAELVANSYIVNENESNPLQTKVAPVGLAYQAIRKQDELFWAKLYARDDFHPSPHGTLLEAYTIYCTIVQERPPMYNPAWWNWARYMQPPDTEPLPLPTAEEASALRDVAWTTCQKSMK